MNPQCIITGCDLQTFGADGTVQWSQHGDLWRLGSVYIFNAVGKPVDGEVPGDGPVLSIKFSNSVNYFARRNVYVIASNETEFNKAARAYLARSPA